MFGENINDRRPVRFLRQEVEKEGAERFVIEIGSERQVNVRHEELLGANNNLPRRIFFIVKPEGTEGVIGEETIANLNPAPAHDDAHHPRVSFRVEHKGEGAKEDQDGEKKILHHHRSNDENESN